MKDLEKICEYEDVCKTYSCLYSTTPYCMLDQDIIINEHLNKIRYAEGLDYLYFVDGEEIE